MARQQVFREAHGRYSKLIAPVGLAIPPQLGDQYDIWVTEAGPDRLQVMAQTEGVVAAPDRVTIDESFHLKANFALPAPRPGYLRYVALKTLRALQAGAVMDPRLEKTAFKSFFRYERRTDSRQRIVAAAIGEQQPVLGQKLEFGPEGLTSGSEWAILMEAFGQGTAAQDYAALRSSEQFSRKVFQRELGRGPDSPEELLLFAGIQPEPTPANRDVEPEIEALQTPVEAENRAPASALATAANPSKIQGNFRGHGLVIESITEDN